MLSTKEDNRELLDAKKNYGRISTESKSLQRRLLTEEKAAAMLLDKLEGAVGIVTRTTIVC